MSAILKELYGKLDADAKISEVNFEASEVVLYTKSKEFFRTGEDKIRELVKDLKKRVEIRPDLSICLPPDETKEIILREVPEEAGVKDIYFEPELGKVIIEAQKPGLVIGKGGETFRKIRNESLWLPKIERAPAIKSDIVRAIRSLLHTELAYRKKFLNNIGQRINTPREYDKRKDWVRISTLGAFREVGRSCMLVQTEYAKIMLDCGVDVGGTFPYINIPELDLEDLDAICLSHAHIDHCAYIPYLYENGYKGPLYCTPPTRDLMVLLCLDYVDVAQKDGKEVPYSKKAIEKAVKHTITLDYGEVSDIAPSIRLTFQPAGHILGSSLVHLHIGDGLHNILYTGDYKYGPTKLFDPAYTDFQRVETVITEATYGSAMSIMPPRREVESRFFEIIDRTMARGGKLLIPSFAVGRAQELIAMLGQRKDFPYPVYVEGMVWDATAIHTAYPEYLSSRLQREIFHYGNNPFIHPMFKHVEPRERDGIIDSTDPAVVIATSGMLIGGPAVEYLKGLAPNPKNTLMFVGYQAEGTPGRRIQKGWKELVGHGPDGRTKVTKIEMEVETLSGMSGHSDRNQLIAFIKNLSCRPEKVLINHGEQSRCLELARDIKRYLKIDTHVPKNLEAVRLK
ncbi:MAG: beta-CASP ribonuclease aCPSF1 [Candidatus Aenigmarchaeota archaeon]|nr:beta-CASP ribonuclease aCPSF1 [Candidatus Aenigmarchaeota archaeon]